MGRKKEVSDSDSELNIDKPKGKNKVQKKRKQDTIWEVGEPSKKALNCNDEVQRKNIRDEVESQCRPDLVVSLLQSLSDDKKQAIYDIGFGSLFEMKVTDFGRRMIPALCERYNGIAHWFKVRGDIGFHLSNDDVYDFFKLPDDESNPVEEIATGMCSQYDDDQYKFRFREKFGLGTRDPVPLKTVREHMLKEQCGIAEFKQLAVLYLFGVFFNPTSNRNVDLKLLKAVEDVDKIREKAWGPYVRTKMGLEMQGHLRHNTKNVGGCIMLVQLAYFHRLQFDGEVQETTLPLISHWTDEKIELRTWNEMYAGELGLGYLDTQTYPISKKLRLQKATSVPVSGCIAQAENAIQFPLYPGLATDDDINRVAVNDEHKTLLLFKRDSEAMNKFYNDRLAALKTMVNDMNVQVGEENGGDSSDEDLNALSDTQFFNHRKVIMMVEREERRWEAMKKAAAEFPTFELLSQSLSGDYYKLGGSSSGPSRVNAMNTYHVPAQHRDFEDIVRVGLETVQLSDGLDKIDCSDVTCTRPPRSLNALQMERSFRMISETSFPTKGVRTKAANTANASKSSGGNQGSAPTSATLKPAEQSNVADKGANAVQSDKNLANSDGNVGSADVFATLKAAQESNVAGKEGTPGQSYENIANKSANGGSAAISAILKAVQRSNVTANKENTIPSDQNLGNSAHIRGSAPSSGIQNSILSSKAAQNPETSGAPSVSAFRSPLRSSFPQTVESDGLGCTLDCGSVCTLVDPVSTLMKGNMELLSYMPSLRKRTCDYCFVDDSQILPADERIVCCGNGHMLLRKDLITLYPSKNVSRKVVESWALLMNALEWDERIYPHRFFFGLSHVDNFIRLGCTPQSQKRNVRNNMHSDFDTWISINTHHYDVKLADLIFVPIEFEDNYFAVLINFVAQRFDILDHRIHLKEDENLFKSMAERLCVELIVYFKKREHPRANELEEFRLCTFPFPWMMKKVPKYDSAVFLMLHMLNFQGEKFASDLSNSRSRRMYRAEIAVALALSDFNTFRDEVLPKVDQFHKKTSESIEAEQSDAVRKRKRSQVGHPNQNLGRNQPPQRRSPRLSLAEDDATAAKLAEVPGRNVIRISVASGSNARRMSPRVVSMG